MRQAPRNIRETRQEDSVRLVMVVSLEDELVPLVRLSSVLQEVSQTHRFRHLQSEQRLLQVSGRILPAEVQEVVGCRQEYVVLDRANRREDSTVPEFPDVTLIARRHVVIELLLRDQFS